MQLTDRLSRPKRKNYVPIHRFIGKNIKYTTRKKRRVKIKRHLCGTYR